MTEFVISFSGRDLVKFAFGGAVSMIVLLIKMNLDWMPNVSQDGISYTAGFWLMMTLILLFVDWILPKIMKQAGDHHEQ